MIIDSKMEDYSLKLLLSHNKYPDSDEYLYNDEYLFHIKLERIMFPQYLIIENSHFSNLLCFSLMYNYNKIFIPLLELQTALDSKRPQWAIKGNIPLQISGELISNNKKDVMTMREGSSIYAKLKNIPDNIIVNGIGIEQKEIKTESILKKK